MIAWKMLVGATMLVALMLLPALILIVLVGLTVTWLAMCLWAVFVSRRRQ